MTDTVKVFRSIQAARQWLTDNHWVPRHGGGYENMRGMMAIMEVRAGTKFEVVISIRQMRRELRRSERDG